MATQMTIQSNWRFHYGECENAWYKGYDDASWTPVSIPHDWAVSMPFSQKCSSGTGYLPGGTGWYRLHFKLPKDYEGQHIDIVFDGVYKNSQVWINSYYLGQRPNGYIGFQYDISDRLVYGEEENVLCVKVVHTDIADSRWYTGSGIYRKVWLNIANPVHPQLDSLAFSTSIDFAKEKISASIQISQDIVNHGREDETIRVVARLYDGKDIAFEEETIVTSKAKDTVSYKIEGNMEHPKLWSVEEPNLYSLQLYYIREAYEQESSLLEDLPVTTVDVGIRAIYFDPDEGFLLNQKPMTIKGVCLHHDGGCLGAAMTKEVWQRRLERLKESGCNAIRCSHNPHMPELYDLCDHMGFLVMDEAFDEWENPKNKWSTGHNVYPPKHEGYYEAFPMWHEADLQAMVRQNRIHPSIIAWSIGNEIDYPNDPYCHPLFQEMTGNNDANKPSAERMYDPNKPNAERMITIGMELAHIVREEDKTRPVTLAAAFPELSTQIGLMTMVDLAGYNYKEHLYEDDHKRFPQVPIIGSENGHNYEAWKAVENLPYISGQFLWTGIDYLGEARGWPIYGSGAGMITTAGFIKPKFERRKTYWLDEPSIYISTKPVECEESKAYEEYFHWNYKPGEMIDVSCYWSLKRKGYSTKLYLNDTCIGESQMDKNKSEEHRYSVRIPFEEGQLTAYLYNEEGEQVAVKTVETTGESHHLNYRVYKASDCITDRTYKEVSAMAGYIYQIEVEVQDSSDRTVPTDAVWLKVQVEGNGDYLGIDNGNLSDVTPYISNRRRCYQGKAIVYVRRNQPGDISVSIDGGEAVGRQQVQLTEGA